MHSRDDPIRHVNRFYTRQMGLLKPAYLDSQLSLTQVRVLYELAHRDGLMAKDLIAELDLDPGYLSRVLAAYARRGWIRRAPSAEDARQQHLSPLALERQQQSRILPGHAGMEDREHRAILGRDERLLPLPVIWLSS